MYYFNCSKPVGVVMATEKFSRMMGALADSYDARELEYLSKTTAEGDFVDMDDLWNEKNWPE